MANINLLCDVSELQWVFNDSFGIDEYLNNIVKMTAHHMHADVCSVYLFDASSETLVLKATHGLNRAFVNRVQLKSGEGITGSAFKEMQSICDNHGSNNPHYHFVDGLNEELFDAFLAVPIIRGIDRTGVLVVQRKAGNDFSDDDLLTLRAVANQLANIVENARELMALRGEYNQPGYKSVPAILKFVKGKAATGGFARGTSKLKLKSRTIDTGTEWISHREFDIDDFQKAVLRTRDQLTERQRLVEERLSDVASLIFTAHLMLLQDELFYGKIVNRIHEGVSADKALIETARYFMNYFSSQDNPHLREKADDVRDLSSRLFENLIGLDATTGTCEGQIIIARELMPSDILVLSSEKIEGIILIAGGVTSHIAVLARSLNLPLVIADESGLLDLPDGTPMAIDGESGMVHIHPTESVLTSFTMREQARREHDARKGAIAEATFTSDGSTIQMLANINLLSDVKTALDLKAEGVGLYRTEFPFIIRNTFPTEEEQFVIYRKLVEQMKGRPVTFRTLDIGGDKILSYYNHHSEQNPFLGLRSIRFAFRHPEVFRQQVRAILRAGADADLRIMFPMITTLEELADARSIVTSCITELRNEKHAVHVAPKIGMMIEIPAVVEVIDAFAAQADFFSIGTNDFIQYMLAVDRTNEKVASLYLAHHPAVLRALKRVADAAFAHSIPVSICGDMAHQEEYLPFLLGIGIRTLSVDAMYLQRISSAVSRISITEAQSIAAVALRETSLQKIREIFGI